MRRNVQKWLSVALTVVVVLIAIPIGKHLWDFYTVSPWTRDGRISAETVLVAPDVSGLITQVAVQDNQMVKRGQVLFVIDRARYELAVAQAETQVNAQRDTLQQAQREAARNQQLSDLVAQESREQSNTKVQQAQQALDAAELALRLARLNLERTVVRSPVEGYLNDLMPHVGDYVSTGHPVVSIVDSHSFYVVGYFEETKLNGIALNQPVLVHIMGDDHVLTGHVQSMAAGIANRDLSNNATLLPDVNPTFSWVRLAQRIPVKVALDQVPSDMRMIVGRTATVSVVSTHPSKRVRL